jgi:hypothetical protein
VASSKNDTGPGARLVGYLCGPARGSGLGALVRGRSDVLGHNVLGHDALADNAVWHPFRRSRFGRTALALGGRQGGKDLLAMDLDVFGCCDPQPDLVPPDLQNRNHNVLAYHDALVDMPRQYQHCSLLPWAMGGA